MRYCTCRAHASIQEHDRITLYSFHCKSRIKQACSKPNWPRTVVTSVVARSFFSIGRVRGALIPPFSFSSVFALATFLSSIGECPWSERRRRMGRQKQWLIEEQAGCERAMFWTMMMLVVVFGVFRGSLD